MIRVALIGLLILSGCVVPAASPSGTIVWTNRPANGTLLPGAELKWELGSGIQRLGNDTVVLETAAGPFTICERTRDVCWLPGELEAGATFSWWVRTTTDRGLLRSPTFHFRTPESLLDLQVPEFDTQAVSPFGKLAWTTTGPVQLQHAIFTAKSNGVATLCIGNPCQTSEPLLASERYNVEVRSYDAIGLFERVTFVDVGVNQPPSASRAVFPATGTEVAAGSVRLEWSAPSDRENDAVHHEVEYRDLASPAWHVIDAGTSQTTQLVAGAGTKTMWRVRSEDAEGNRVTGPIAAFATPGAPAASIPVSPAIGEVVPPLAPISFQWEAQTMAARSVQVSLDNETWTDVCSGANRCISSGPLRSASTYYWRITEDAGYYGTATSAVEVFRTTDPVVLVHGLLGSADTWKAAIPAYTAKGLEVLDFEPGTPGTQALRYQPTSGDEHAGGIAARVAAAIATALRGAGYSDDVPVALVGHSYGGLIARIIAENLPSLVRVAQVVTLGTPHRGAELACAFASLPFSTQEVLMAAFSAITGVTIESLRFWNGVIQDLCAATGFIDLLNSSSKTPYRAVAGNLDQIVSIASATYGATTALLVASGHTGLPGADPRGVTASMPWLVSSSA